MPLGAARLTLLAFQPTVAVEAEVIRKKVGVIAAGNAQVDTAQYKFGGASALFDGTNDKLTAKTSEIQWGTLTTWTIEFWMRWASTGVIDSVVGTRSLTNTVSPGEFQFVTLTSNKLQLNVKNTAGTQMTALVSGNTISQNTWHHIAIVRDGNTYELFLDGTSEGSQTLSGDLSDKDIFFGEFAESLDYNGHIDEFRLSNTARYTSGFTPSTTPFTNDDNTLLLLHMNGTDGSTFFEDDNGVRESVSLNVVGNTQIDTARSKFGGASALFDGSGDGLNVSASTGSPFYLIEGSWTVECFFNVDNDTGSSTVGLVIVGSHPSLPNYGGGILWRNFDLKLQASWDAYNGTDPKQDLITSAGSTLALDTWHHAAMVYDADASTWSVYQNGTRIANETVTYSGVKLGDNGQFWIGSGVGSFNAGGNGWIDEVRVSNTARYTGASYTVPTAEFTNDEDTISLFHMNGTDGSTVFRDDNGTGRISVGVSAIQNAQIDTAQYKFGGASLLLDGVNDALEIHSLDNSAFDYGDSDFTIECWARRNTNSSNFEQIIGSWHNGTAANRSWFLGVDNTTTKIVFYWYDNGNVIDTSMESTSTISNDTWYHLAVVGDATNVKLYIDGTEEASTTRDTFRTPVVNIRSGCTDDDALDFGGHIDEIRISNNARYTSGFTAPTEPFQNDTNTLLLLHMDGTDGSTVFIDDNGKHPPA